MVAGSPELRAQPVEVLAKVTEPEIEVNQLDLGPGIQGESAQVVMLVFGDDEETPLRFLQEMAEQAFGPRSSRYCPNTRRACCGARCGPGPTKSCSCRLMPM